MDERYENEQLYHHGTKGMKWGVRRYQNADGSLTAAGRVRYGVGKARDKIGSAVKTGVQKHKAKVAAKKEEKRIEELMKKPIRKLTDDEIRERAARANNESVLKQIEERNKQAARSFVAKFGSKLVNEAAVPAIVSAGKNIATKFLEKTLSKSLGLDAEDLTNTYELFKKAGFDINKLTDKQVAALATRQDGAKKVTGDSDSNILEELAAVGGDVTKLTDSQMSRLGKHSEARSKYNKVKPKDEEEEEEEEDR